MVAMRATPGTTSAWYCTCVWRVWALVSPRAGLERCASHRSFFAVVVTSAVYSGLLGVQGDWISNQEIDIELPVAQGNSDDPADVTFTQVRYTSLTALPSADKALCSSVRLRQRCVCAPPTSFNLLFD